MQLKNNEERPCHKCKLNILNNDRFFTCEEDKLDYHASCTSDLVVANLSNTSKEFNMERRNKVNDKNESIILENIDKFYSKIDFWEKKLPRKAKRD